MIVHRIRERIDAMFSDLEFDSRRHLYYVNGINYPSVSSLVESHCDKVDFEKIIPNYAAKNDTTVDEVRKSWKQIRDDACALGHNTHSFLESYEGIQVPTNGYEKAGIQFISDMSQDHEIVNREIRMYSRRFRFAGTMDLPLLIKANHRLRVADYKTNKDLFKNYRGKTLLAPFDYLEDTPYNKYQLQLSYYQIMLEEIGLNVEDRLLVHLKVDGTYRNFSTFDLTEQLVNYMVGLKKAS